MSRVESIYRMARQLMLKGWPVKVALEKAKRAVEKHPTAEQIRMARVMRKGNKDG